MKAKDIIKAGVPSGPLVKKCMSLLGPASRSGMKRKDILRRIRSIVAEPESFTEDRFFGSLAKALKAEKKAALSDAGNTGKDDPALQKERKTPAPWECWGRDPDPDAVNQMKNACILPVAVQGALMPDAHSGYGLPIGGVLATDNAVIPYAVGVDIACRMRLTVTDMPVDSIVRNRQNLINVLESETLFGKGEAFSRPYEHPVMDEDWNFSPVLGRVKEKARGQLGTSGSGNHFAEFGIFNLSVDLPGISSGKYMAFLTHSGSRRAGAMVADYYWKLARDLNMNLPRHLHHLSWLMMDSDPGREYWKAMQIMGRYAAANHEIIHRKIIRALKAGILLETENHHNFAWKEKHGGRELIVHRKGATPASKGVYGMIPGTMASPGFLVRGKGVEKSLNSASHGAGRQMSRTEARRTFTRKQLKKELEAAGVVLLSAGIDEAPGAYKDIHKVMREQEDLVEIMGSFNPKIVKMADD